MNELSDKYTSATRAILTIMPPEEIDLLIARGQAFSRERWFWGDTVNLWIKRTLGSGLLLTRGDAIRALSQISGIGQSTLRRYGYVADFYPPEIRELYAPLPFSHFATAKRFGDCWKDVLDKAMSYFERYGRYPSSEYLEWTFSTNAQPVIEINNQLLKDMEFKAYPVNLTNLDYQTPDNPEASQIVAQEWLVQFDLKLSSLLLSVEKIPASETAKDRLRAAVSDLTDALKALLEEISVQAKSRN